MILLSQMMVANWYHKIFLLIYVRDLDNIRFENIAFIETQDQE